MSSFRGNNRGANSLRSSRALGAGLALVLASGTALADGAQRFVFTAYSDATGGAEVMTGRYRAALEELRSQPGHVDFDPSATNTNRCVAYSMTLQWQEARAACDAAVRAAEAQRTSRSSRWKWMHAANDERVAVAYSNRAVLRWLSSDETAASQDLVKARELSPQADFVARNLAALGAHAEMAKAHGEMARAGAPSPRS